MTEDEAKRIAGVIGRADSACSVCVKDLCERMTKQNFGFEFECTGNEIRVQAVWSDDPEDTERLVEVIVKPTKDKAYNKEICG